MQIICPNCGSKSPIEAGSLVTQTRIVCARCAVEFAAELSDEQKATPALPADERGIELFGAPAAASVFPALPAAEVVAPPSAEVAPAEENSDDVRACEVLPAEEVATVEPAHEAPAAADDEVSPALKVAAVAEAVPADQDSRSAGDRLEVLSLPEEAAISSEAASESPAAEDDHSNVLEDVFAAWTQSRESKFEHDAAEAVSLAAEEYVTSPLSSDYEVAAREEGQPEAERTERPPSATLEAPADVPAALTNVLKATTSESVGPVGETAEEVAETADDERETVHASFAGAAPQVAAAQSFDGYGLGVRLMRVSPIWLLVTGLSFISFVVFCNWFFVPANLAQSEPPPTASRRNAATNRSLASAADTSSARPDSRNSGTSGASLPAEGEVVNASLKVEGPTPAPTAPTATPAPTAEPTATPKAEQPKAAEAVAPQPAPAGRFTVQVGSYNAPGEAEARAAGLRSAGQTVRVAEIEIPRRGKWYRVYVGGFASRGEAESHGKGLRERGLAESYIATEAR